MASLNGTISTGESLTGEINTAIGITPDIQIGTVETSTYASVELDENSTKLKPVFNFKIPKGEKGDTGKTGEQGETGNDGEDAYVSAQKGGFTGTVEEFYTSLASIGFVNEVLDNVNGEVV